MWCCFSEVNKCGESFLFLFSELPRTAGKFSISPVYNIPVGRRTLRSAPNHSGTCGSQGLSHSKITVYLLNWKEMMRVGKLKIWFHLFNMLQQQCDVNPSVEKKSYYCILICLWLQLLLQAINNIDEVSPCLQNFLKRYNDEFSGEGLDLMVSSHVMFHVVRLHRILSYKNR